MQQVFIQLTGKAILTTLGLTVAALGALALVWMLVGPSQAIAIGFGLLVLVRGLVSLLSPGK